MTVRTYAQEKTAKVYEDHVGFPNGDLGRLAERGSRKTEEEGSGSALKTTIRMAYLVSQYPGISHTFILREVLALRELGFDIQVASINAPDRETGELTAEERVERARTMYVKKAGWINAVRASVREVVSQPWHCLRALGYALKLGRTDQKRKLVGLFYFAEAVLIADWMRRQSLTHLHVHFATPASTVGLITAKLSGASLSITVHGPDEFYDVTNYHLAEKIEGSQFLCAIGKFARSQLMKLSPVEQWDKFEVTPLGVDTKNFCARPARRQNNNFEILCVGRLVPAKGQHVLIRACARLVKAGQNVQLRFVGDGPDRSSLKSLAETLGVSERTTFEGSVNQEKIQNFYQQADAFVLPSFAEGIPVVLMEAMAMAIPCVTTRITGIPELISEGIDGLLVTASDDEELAGAIMRLIREPRLRHEIGEAGRQKVLSRYDLRVNVRHLAEVFRRRLEA